MGSEQSQPAHKKVTSRAPPIRRGHTIAAPNRPDTSKHFEPSASGNDSPGASVCSDTELPYISYTVDRPIGDSPKCRKPSAQPRAASAAPRRRSALSLQAHRARRAHDIVVVTQPPTEHALDDDIRRLQEIPTFLPIMRGTLGLVPDSQAGLDKLDYSSLYRLVSRQQAHLGACAHALHSDQAAVPAAVRQIDLDISKLHAQFVERQRSNARNAERLSRVREISHQLSRCNSLLNQTLQDVDELNNLLPEDMRLAPFIWNT